MIEQLETRNLLSASPYDMMAGADGLFTINKHPPITFAVLASKQQLALLEGV